MGFLRSLLPEPAAYFQGQELFPRGSGAWFSTGCVFHGGRDSMRVKRDSGAYVCMNCGVKGGDVLSYHMQAHGMGFVEAARDLGAWIDDGAPPPRTNPAPLPARDAIQILATEANLVVIAALNARRGVVLTDADKERLIVAGARINRICEAYQ